MYFPVGWPTSINLSPSEESFAINHVSCDAVKILIAAISDRILGIWYANPLIPITFHQRTLDSYENYGYNKLIVWKPDSKQILILTSKGTLLLYYISFDPNGNGVLSQKDSPSSSLKRDSAELFIKENVPRLSLHLQRYICFDTIITSLNCISLTEILISTEQSTLLKVLWSDFEENVLDENSFNLSDEFSINLQDIPIYANHQSCAGKSLPLPINKELIVTCLEYSPFIGGCAIVFRNKRAGFLVAKQLRFETQNLHMVWVPDIDDATICSVNHKFRLLAYGRENSEVSIFGIEDATGGLEFTHRLICHHNSTPEALGAVNEMKWSPDGCVLAVTWTNGGISLWSTFGTLLMCSLNWDFGLHVNLQISNPIQVSKLEWSTEGYHLFLTCQPQSNRDPENANNVNVLQMSFVKSTLTTNPCMASHSHILLQGDNTLYLNQGDSLETTYFGSDFIFPNNQKSKTTTYTEDSDDDLEVKRSDDLSRVLSESKHWTVLQLPLTYAATNWPIRYSCINDTGLNIAVAGRTGLAHYSLLTKKWKVFGNETQEKDFVVSGGLLWWKDFILMGCYSILDRTDEVRYYPQETKLDNQYGNKILVRAPVITINLFQNQLVILTGDGIVSLFVLSKLNAYNLDVKCVYEVDVKGICIHPACIVSLNVTNLKHEPTPTTNAEFRSSSLAAIEPADSAVSSNVAETIIVNICGRILMVQTETGSNIINSCLASCVECFWITNDTKEKGPMSDCLWFYSGSYGMRVWLPISPPLNEQMSDSTHRMHMHTFMSKRIMLSFPLKLYPLAILFDNVIVVGVENENTLYTNEAKSHFSLPFNLLGRKSQVYLHKILRQLIKRNLGYNAWKIAQSCCALPYFPHSLELLLHEVLEEEATSKRIADALLPSILAFIREFPIYLQTIVQCARKTEIALWPYLFSMAGKPKDIFQLCVQANELETAASYLIILQNLESSTVSKHHATMLLEICLQKRKWKLAKDLNRFLKAIDPNEIDSPRSSMIINMKIAPPIQQSQAQVNQNSEAFNMILGPIARERSYSTTTITTLTKETKKEKPNNEINTPASSATKDIVTRRKSERSLSMKDQHNNNSQQQQQQQETFGIDEILHNHAQNLLKKGNLIDLGYMSAFLDFHLVKWLSQESEKAARLDDYVVALINLHQELHLPEPFGEENSLEQTSIDYCSQLQEQFFNEANLQNHNHITSSRTSESGYNSMAFQELPYNSFYNNIQSIKEGKEMSFPPNHLNNMNNIKSHLSSPSSDHIDDSAFYPLNEQLPSVDFESSIPSSLKADPTKNFCANLSEKLNIKLRYLLQLFTEAHCLDFAIVLSILLQDGASITRIVNILSRSKSLATVQRIENALKHLTQKCFQCETKHRSFMISIQPFIYALEQITDSASLSHNHLNLGTNLEDIKSSLSNLTSDGKPLSRLNHHNSNYLNQNGRNSVSLMNWTDDDDYTNNHNLNHHHNHHHHHHRNHRLSINSNYETTNINSNNFIKSQQIENTDAANNKCSIM